MYNGGPGGWAGFGGRSGDYLWGLGMGGWKGSGLELWCVSVLLLGRLCFVLSRCISQCFRLAEGCFLLVLEGHEFPPAFAPPPPPPPPFLSNHCSRNTSYKK